MSGRTKQLILRSAQLAFLGGMLATAPMLNPKSTWASEEPTLYTGQTELDLRTWGGHQATREASTTRVANDACSLCSLDVTTCTCLGQTGHEVARPAYRPLFWDNDFSYLCDPCYDRWWPGEGLKRRAWGEHILFDIGGQYRTRLHNERNMRRLGLTGNDDDFLLHRSRVFLNLEVGHYFRAYAEFLDAESNYENLAPRSIEVNRADMLNLFGDLLLLENCQGQAWARVGRQELLYGAQRTVSPLDWANTRRTFEGYKAFWQGEQWDVDAFYTRPVVTNATQFDSPDYDQEFMGTYATYRGRTGRTADFYYLRYNNGDASFQFDTLGTRLQGSREDWLWEFEGAVQFGDNSDGSDHSAGFWVAGLGRKFTCYPWSPSLWCYYDWASGSDDLGAGNGYHHLFPLAHKYLGFMDLFGRRNVESANVLLTLSPTKKTKLLLWYYYLFLENRNDSPYNINMTAFNPGNAPASADLGHELDVILTYSLNERANLLFGYSHFFAGQYYQLTPGVPYRDDADFFYTQFTVDF